MVITVKDKDYIVEKIYYRTKGSHNQILTEDIGAPGIEIYARYFLADNDDKKYWIKEISFPSEFYKNFPTETNCQYEIEKEYMNIIMSNFSITHNNYILSAVEAFDYFDNRLVLEYCDGYKKYKEVEPELDKGIVRNLLLEWIDILPLKNYDMNKNNILVKKEGDSVLIKMIDFADSHIRPIEKCKSLIMEITK